MNTCAKVVKEKFGQEFLTKDFFRILFALWNYLADFMADEWVVSSKYHVENPLQRTVNSLQSVKNAKGLTLAMSQAKSMAAQLINGSFPTAYLHLWPFTAEITGAEYVTPKYQNIKENENKILATIPANTHGIYMLYNESQNLIYVGKSRNLPIRIATSAQERGASFVRIIETATMADMHILEPYLIAIHKPSLNTDHTCPDAPTFTIPVPAISEFIPLICIL